MKIKLEKLGYLREKKDHSLSEIEKLMVTIIFEMNAAIEDLQKQLKKSKTIQRLPKETKKKKKGIFS